MENPYVDFDETTHPEDLQGWNSDTSNFAALIEEYKPKLVVEVGSWKGASAINIARHLDPESLLVCVDTWLGSIEHRFHKDHYYDSYRMKNGYPQIYYTFLANIKRANLQDKVLPFPNGSVIAARWFAEQGIRPDLVYIDGSHDIEDVFMDLTCWFNLTKPGGAVFGDDWGWESVQEALHLFQKQNDISFELLCSNQWVIRKKDQHATDLKTILGR